ncbi:hypothetical protein FDI41_gp09 [Arthrobacter phage Piccoletto]|uniref:Uncharacterized protein n=1 Tax=Arthrobacter phage Piccoletto TaxID=2024282 RepID=A0A222Z9A7_9CAUD|nr:hypothetical protein FDI41_gp09 [Arthrobacter phage Piccoletto]ASR80640.1 hypothetical protein SEA_PICCOLETTO_9 [Arthrobacter phage Piccoletto]
MAARNTRSTRTAAKPAAAATASSLEQDLTPPQTLAEKFGVEKAAPVPSNDEIEALKAADEAAGVGVAETTPDAPAGEQEPDSDADETTDAEADANRAAELQKFVTGEIEEQKAAEPEPVVLDVSGAKDFGGDVVVQVLFDYYRVNIGERETGIKSKLAHKGELIRVDEKTAERGVRIGGLREIEG